MNTVSIILPVYNEQKYIARCLISLIKQTQKILDVIVVDDGSTDKSMEIIRGLVSAHNIRNLRILNQSHQGPAAARNLGARTAMGDILIFADADMIYDRNYISELIIPLAKKQSIAAFALSEYVANMDNIWAKLWDDITFANHGKRMVKNQPKFGTVARAILKSEFIKSGGFISSGTSDDRSVLERLGKNALGVQKAKCYHFNPSSLSEIYISSRWMGRDSSNIGKTDKFFIYSLLWSIVSALAGSWKRKNLFYLPFRIVFDFGYWLGLFDINILKKHYK